jgi:hypothetical protein
MDESILQSRLNPNKSFLLKLVSPPAAGFPVPTPS